MAVLDFPNSPTVGQQYTADDRIWVWTASGTWDTVESEVVSGPTGPTGPAGPANTLSIGSVTSGDPDVTASVSITGTAPVQELNFVLKQGPTGPPNSLSIGTITTGNPGTTAAASITGTPPNQTLSLTIPQGPTGPQGPAGTVAGSVIGDLDNVTITGTPSDNSLLAYDTATSQWINQTASEAGVAALSGATFTGSITGTSASFSGTVAGQAAPGTLSNASIGIGYMGIPTNGNNSGAYELVIGDAGEHIYTTASRTVTIPANSSVAFPIGTTIVFISGAGATTTIAITSDTLILAGAGTTGSRTLAAHGIATAVKVASTTWYISGNGLT